ncbi:DUF2637 domain-containing protein [Amycolatopsis sp. NPDC005232]|uniref:DUF2637 domain-containing protein n=1 Tax=Amycolatopsis sp. NPDC005232 TaxID=3157027 RepID=UPI0033AFB13D
MKHTNVWLLRDPALAGQCFCIGLVALGAAYASYRHGREFALRFGADTVTASIWPLLVDGLLTIATVELWKSNRGGKTSGRWVAWLGFAFGICLSLVVNICSAPMLSALRVIVAACPPLVLLLAVELLNGALKRRAGNETGSEKQLAAWTTSDGSRGSQNRSSRPNYQGNPEVAMPYRKPRDGSELPDWKQDLNATHRKFCARVEHALSRMKNFKILRDYRRAASTLADTVSGIAYLHNILLDT